MEPQLLKKQQAQVRVPTCMRLEQTILVRAYWKKKSAHISSNDSARNTVENNSNSELCLFCNMCGFLQSGQAPYFILDNFFCLPCSADSIFITRGHPFPLGVHIWSKKTFQIFLQTFPIVLYECVLKSSSKIASFLCFSLSLSIFLFYKQTQQIQPKAVTHTMVLVLGSALSLSLPSLAIAELNVPNPLSPDATPPDKNQYKYKIDLLT